MQFAPENAVSIGTALGLIVSTVWLHSRISELEEKLETMDTGVEEIKEVIKTVLPAKDIANKAKEDIDRLRMMVATVKSYRPSEDDEDEDDEDEEELIRQSIRSLN